MRLLLAIIICKLLYFAGSKIGKGSSLPGQAALALCPDALKRVKLPETVIAVTGSNGKTSTTELIAHALKANGLRAAWNHEGANQTEGVATMILRSATLGGKLKRDVLLFESDERYAHKTFEAVQPTVFVITNLFRDQLTRNGHHEFIQGCIQKAIETAAGKGRRDRGLTLVLNADDPYVSALAEAGKKTLGGLQKEYYFGISGTALNNAGPTRNELPGESFSGAAGMYDDGAFCPVCKSRMQYEYRIASHLGDFRCAACGHCRPQPDVEAAGIDFETGEVRLADRTTTRIAVPGLTGAYNQIAAITAAAAAGLSVKDSARTLDGFELTGGRTERFMVGGRGGTLLVSKHENSASYDQSLLWAVGQRKKCAIVVMVDSISRKYYTSETSWLWDVDFGILNDSNVLNVVLTGRYVNELAARFAMTDIDPGKITCIQDNAVLRSHIEQNTGGEIYALTCFSDKDKLLKSLK